MGEAKKLFLKLITVAHTDKPTHTQSEVCNIGPFYRFNYASFISQLWHINSQLLPRLQEPRQPLRHCMPPKQLTIQNTHTHSHKHTETQVPHPPEQMCIHILSNPSKPIPGCSFPLQWGIINTLGALSSSFTTKVIVIICLICLVYNLITCFLPCLTLSKHSVPNTKQEPELKK